MTLKKLSDWRFKGYALHFILWSALLLLNYFIFGMPGIEFDFTFSFGSWMIYILLFYLNYSLLIPKFLFMKKYVLFGVSLMFALSINLYFKRVIDNHFFEQRFLKENGLFMDKASSDRMEFPPNEMNAKPADRMSAAMKGATPINPPRIWRFSLDRFFMPGLSQLLLIILASISLRFVKKWQDDEKIKAEIEKEKISTELLFLKQQINPHFLFNAINSIYSLSISQMPETADAIIKLSSILRYMLYETDKKFVSLNSEIQVINNYIELQKLRLTDKVKLQYVVEGIISEYQIVPLLLLPLIENAFKHGIDNANNSFIGIMIEVKAGELYLTIINTIVPRNTSAEGSGIGIKNIIRRLELLYPDAYSFESSTDSNVFKVNLKLKLEK